MNSAVRGFSLLEVLVAMAVLGLGLTTILSAQAGLFSTSMRGANMTYASSLARCKMSELEAVLLRDGFPLMDEKNEGQCCEGDDEERFACSWIVETVILPEIEETGDGGLTGLMDGGSVSGMSDGLSLDGGLSPGKSGAMSPMSLLSGSLPGMPASVDDPLSGMAEESGGLGGIASMAIGMVYPTLKPMLEASIRRVVVTVAWKEGSNERTFELGQYLTNPQQGGMLADLEGAGLTSTDTTTTTGTTGATGTTGTPAGATKNTGLGSLLGNRSGPGLFGGKAQ